MNSSRNVVALNVREINKLMLDISDYVSKIKIIFNKINDMVLETRSYYNCLSANILRAKYELFAANYNTIINNIMSYNNELTLLKKKYAVNIDNLSQKIKNDASRMNTPTSYKEGR